MPVRCLTQPTFFFRPSVLFCVLLLQQHGLCCGYTTYSTFVSILRAQRTTCRTSLSFLFFLFVLRDTYRGVSPPTRYQTHAVALVCAADSVMQAPSVDTYLGTAPLSGVRLGMNTSAHDLCATLEKGVITATYLPTYRNTFFLLYCHILPWRLLFTPPTYLMCWRSRIATCLLVCLPGGETAEGFHGRRATSDRRAGDTTRHGGCGMRR